MKPFAVVTVATVAVLAFTGVAHAEITRVVVAGAEGDPVANRMQKELTAMGFEAVRVDDPAACSQAAITGWMDQMHALGAACSDGSTVGVWVVSSSGLRMADVVTPQDDGAHSATAPDMRADMLALRAAEVVRATLELPSGDAEPAPPKPQPTWATTTHASDTDVAKLLEHPPKAVVPHTPLVVVGTGIAAVMGADAKVPAVDFDAQLRLFRYLAIAARAEIPLQSTNITTANTTVKVAPAVFTLGPSFALTSSDSFFIPRLGTGVGFVWLQSESVGGATGVIAPRSSGTNSFRTINTPQNSDDIFSPLVYANLSGSLRVAAPFRLVFDAMLGTTTYRMVVRDESNQHIAYWGQPFGTLSIRGELMFQ